MWGDIKKQKKQNKLNSYDSYPILQTDKESEIVFSACTKKGNIVWLL